MEINNQETPKQDNGVIFGLSPLATIVNAYVLIFLNEVIWVLYALNQYSHGVAMDVPWLIHLPLSILAMIMLIKWTDNKYELGREMSHRGFRLRMVFGFMIPFLVQTLFKVTLAILLFPLFS